VIVSRIEIPDEAHG